MCCSVDDVPRSHGGSTTKHDRLREQGDSFEAREGRQRQLRRRSGHPLFRRCPTDPILSRVSDHKTDSKNNNIHSTYRLGPPLIGLFRARGSGMDVVADEMRRDSEERHLGFYCRSVCCASYTIVNAVLVPGRFRSLS